MSFIMLTPATFLVPYNLLLHENLLKIPQKVCFWTLNIQFIPLFLTLWCLSKVLNIVTYSWLDCDALNISSIYFTALLPFCLVPLNRKVIRHRNYSPCPINSTASELFWLVMNVHGTHLLLIQSTNNYSSLLFKIQINFYVWIKS
jgi:hypothetical protein